MAFFSTMKSKPLTRKLLQSHNDKFNTFDGDNQETPRQYRDTDSTSPISYDSSQYSPASHGQPYERRPSSFYSQPELPYPLKFTNPWDGPDSSDRFDIDTTQKTIESENATAAVRDPTQAQNRSHGYRAQQVSDMTNILQHTPVSEYIVARSWAREASPSLPPPPPPQSPSSHPLYLLWDDVSGTIRRKSSIFTSSTDRKSSLASLGLQHQRRASSGCSPSVGKAEIQSGKYIEPLVRSTNDTSSSVSRDHNSANMPIRSQHRPQTPTTPALGLTAQAITTQSHRDPPFQTTINQINQKQPLLPVATCAPAALLRGLSQTYSPDTKQMAHPTPHASHPQPHPQPQPQGIFKPSLWSTDPIPPPTRRYRPPEPRRGAKVLHTQTKDSACCDQGKFLGIATMRAVSPAGVDMLQGWMMSSLRKTKSTERGVKEVRKWLKYQDRATVEWVAEWLRHRWGCQL